MGATPAPALEDINSTHCAKGEAEAKEPLQDSPQVTTPFLYNLQWPTQTRRSHSQTSSSSRSCSISPSRPATTDSSRKAPTNAPRRSTEVSPRSSSSPPTPPHSPSSFSFHSSPKIRTCHTCLSRARAHWVALAV